MPVGPELMTGPDSWPPTQVRLTRAVSDKSEPLPLLDDIDDNPLTYFLTPAPSGDDDDGMMGCDEMDFDAGIEDSSHPRQIVRSVSPSSLEGLSKPKYRPGSPDFDSDVTSADEDDEEEDYIRFSPSGLSPLRDLAIDSLRFRPRSPVFGLSTSALLSPTYSPGSPTRGRSRSNGRGVRGHGQSRSLSARPRPRRLWREPSPDVWSIEEETEEELMSEMEGSVTGEQAPVKEAAAKPKKRVRFVLPTRE